MAKDANYAEEEYSFKDGVYPEKDGFGFIDIKKKKKQV